MWVAGIREPSPRRFNLGGQMDREQRTKDLSRPAFADYNIKKLLAFGDGLLSDAQVESARKSSVVKAAKLEDEIEKQPEDTFNLLHARIQVRVRKLAHKWWYWIQAQGVYTDVEAEDLMQSMWLIISQMPNGLSDTEYVEYGFQEATRELALPRMWDIDHRGDYKQEIPMAPEMIEYIQEFQQVHVFEGDFTDKINTELDLERNLDEKHWKLYNLIKDNRDILNWEKEKRPTKDFAGRSEKHTGWTQRELAEKLGVSHQYISQMTKKIVETYKEILKDSGIKVDNTL